MTDEPPAAPRPGRLALSLSAWSDHPLPRIADTARAWTEQSASSKGESTEMPSRDWHANCHHYVRKRLPLPTAPWLLWRRGQRGWLTRWQVQIFQQWRSGRRHGARRRVLGPTRQKQSCSANAVEDGHIECLWMQSLGEKSVADGHRKRANQSQNEEFEEFCREKVLWFQTAASRSSTKSLAKRQSKQWWICAWRASWTWNLESTSTQCRQRLGSSTLFYFIAALGTVAFFLTYFFYGRHHTTLLAGLLFEIYCYGGRSRRMTVDRKTV